MAVTLLALTAAGTSAADQDPFAFFRPTVLLSPRDRAELDRGNPVVSVLGASGHEVGVFTAIALDEQVTPARAVAWMRQIQELRKNRHVLATGRFSNPPRLEDLASLSLNRADLDDLRKCRAGR